jgi:DNA-binding NtrC family response regulator
LAARFLELACERHHKSLRGFDTSAVGVFSLADWTGNVRELQNEIERAVALATDGETITADQLSPSLTTEISGGAVAAIRAACQGVEGPGSGPSSRLVSVSNSRAGASLQDARSAYEARYISQDLGEHGGNVSHAALALRLSRVALQKKMKKYGRR